jgi:hypothetical protein
MTTFSNVNAPKVQDTPSSSMASTAWFIALPAGLAFSSGAAIGEMGRTQSERAGRSVAPAG